MDEQLASYISYLSMFSIAVPALVGLLFFGQLGAIQKGIFGIVLLSVITEIAAEYLSYGGGYQHLVYHIFTILECTMLIYIFALAIKPFFSNTFFSLLWFFFFLFALADLLWLSSIEQFNSYSTVLESLVVIFLAVSFFYKTLSELKVKHLGREPVIWLSIGVLLYFSSSLFIFLFTNYIDASNTTLFIIWGIHAIFSILLNVFYTIALWIRPTR